ncbi:MAG: AAA family ATPase [Verrucomicrobiia bacterium]
MNELLEQGITEPPEVDTGAPAATTTTELLPAWTDAAVFCSTPCKTPPEIIHGVLHQGCKLVLGGSSKTFKSWTQLDMALAVSTGSNWLRFKTTKARVLVCNFELPEFSIHYRLLKIAEARQIEIPADTLTLWNLRGYAAPYGTLLPMLTERIKAQNFGLIIFDPSYKLLGQADENSARDVALLLNAVEKVAVETGAAVEFTAHFAKGSAAQKEAMDRISGSGVFARDPDSILIFTALQTENCFAVESILRTLPPQEPFAVRWEFPVFRVAEDMDPGDLKQPKSRASKIVPTPDQVLELFKTTENPRAALLTSEQLRSLFDTRRWDRTAAPAVRDELIAEGKLAMYHGAHNSKLTGLPVMVEAYTKQQVEQATVLEQPALPTTKKRKSRT